MLLDASRTHPPLRKLLKDKLLSPLQGCLADPSEALAAQAAALAAGILTLPDGDAAVEGRLSDLREAVHDAGSAEPPLVAAGLAAIRNAILARRPAATARLETLCEVARLRLAHPDSFVYQAALNTLAAAAEVEPATMMPKLAQLVLPAGGASAESAARRIKGAQALCQAVLRLGAALPPHADAAVGALLIGARDDCAAVRASCVATLATVASTLRLALHPWAVEILALAAAALQPHRDVAAAGHAPAPTEAQAEALAARDERRAAAFLVGLLLQGLGADAVPLLSVRQLRDLLVSLRAARDGSADEVLRGHAAAAVDQLDGLGRTMLRGAGGPSGLSLRMP